MRIQTTSQRNETRISTFNLLLRAGAAHLWHPAIIDVALNATEEPVASIEQLIASPGFRQGLGERLRDTPSLAAVVESGQSLLDVLKTGNEIYANLFLSGVKRKLALPPINDSIVAEEIHHTIRHQFHRMIGTYNAVRGKVDGSEHTCGFKAYLEVFLHMKVREQVYRILERNRIQTKAQNIVAKRSFRLAPNTHGGEDGADF